MIQRVQSLFLFFSAISSVIIIYMFPVLEQGDIKYLLKDHYPYAEFSLFFSAALSFFAISQFRNRKRQQIIAYGARLMITIAIALIVFLYREDEAVGIGLILFLVPFVLLLAANFFIKKDERLVKSADRIR